MAEETVILREKRPLWQKVALGVVGLVVALAVLAAGLLLFLDTQPGQQFLIRKIAALQLESGMAIEVGRHDGSLYSDITLRILVVRYPKGIFFAAPGVYLVWIPF